MKRVAKCVVLSSISLLVALQAFAYTVKPTSYEWEEFRRIRVTLNDDEMSAAVPLPFSFHFFFDYPYLVPYAALYISSDGFITFLPDQPNGCAAKPCPAQSLPNSDGPNALIAGYWGDLNPAAGGLVSYGFAGEAPRRRFIIEFADVPHYASESRVSFQIKLFESSNEIEIACRSCTSDGSPHTQGIESSPNWQGKTQAKCATTNPVLGLYLYGYDCAVVDGSGANITSERNAAVFSLGSDAVRFIPPNNRTYVSPTVPVGSGDIVAVRYKFIVMNNDGEGSEPAGFKLLFGWSNVYNRGSFDSGVNRYTPEINSSFYTSAPRFADPLCYSGYSYPPDRVTVLPEASFRFDVPDYANSGLTGQKSDQPSAFPRATSTGAIDGIASSSWSASQFDVAGLDGSYQLARGEPIIDKSGWHSGATACDSRGNCSCEDLGLDRANPSHSFRQWDRTITLGGTTYTAHVALAEEIATALLPWSVISFATEYFFTRGRYRLYLWDLEIKRDGSSTWQPLTRWQVMDHDGSTSYFGFKGARYGGQCVLEVSTAPAHDETYLYGATDLAATVFDFATCSSTPTAVTGAATRLRREGAVLNGTANANGTTGSVWFEYGVTAAYGSTTLASQASGSADQAFIQEVTALIPGRVYHYRIVGRNAAGTSLGSDSTFRTPLENPPDPPTRRRPVRR